MFFLLFYVRSFIMCYNEIVSIVSILYIDYDIYVSTLHYILLHIVSDASAASNAAMTEESKLILGP